MAGDWKWLLGGYVTTTAYVAARLWDKDAGAKNRLWLHDLLAKQSLLTRYHRLLDSLEWVLARIFGKARGLGAFGVCLMLAYAYPFAGFVFAYALGGSNRLAGCQLFPTTTRMRWLWPLGVCLFGFVEIYLLRRRQKVDHLVASWPFRRAWLRRALFAVGVGIVCGSVVGAIDSQLDKTFAGPFGGSFLVPFRFVLAFSMTIAFLASRSGAFAAAAAITIGVVIPLSLLHVWPFAIAPLVLTTTSFLAFGFRGLPSAPRLTIMVVSIVCALASLTVALASAGPGCQSFTRSGAFAILVLFVALPITNALFDWVSWRFSRHFIRRARQARHWLTPAWDLLADGFLAVVLMVGLVLVLPSILGSLSTLLDGKGAALEWQGLAASAREAPWTEGLMVTLMVTSTLVPTVLHVAFGVVALLIHLLQGHRLASYLKDLNLEGRYAGNQFQPLLAASWLTGYVALALAIVWGLFRGISRLADLPVAAWLYNISTSVHSPWWSLLLIPLAFVGGLPMRRELGDVANAVSRARSEQVQRR